MCSHVESSFTFKMMVTCNKITSRTFCFDFTRIGTRITCFPYYEIQVKQTNIYIKDTTLISAYPMLLFGGDITVQHREQVIAVDEWIQFKVIILNCFRFTYYVAVGFITRKYFVLYVFLWLVTHSSKFYSVTK